MPFELGQPTGCTSPDFELPIVVLLVLALLAAGAFVFFSLI
jgi:hypothetical protein